MAHCNRRFVNLQSANNCRIRGEREQKRKLIKRKLINKGVFYDKSGQVLQLWNWLWPRISSSGFPNALLDRFIAREISARIKHKNKAAREIQIASNCKFELAVYWKQKVFWKLFTENFLFRPLSKVYRRCSLLIQFKAQAPNWDEREKRAREKANFGIQLRLVSRRSSDWMPKFKCSTLELACSRKMLVKVLYQTCEWACSICTMPNFATWRVSHSCYSCSTVLKAL